MPGNAELYSVYRKVNGDHYDIYFMNQPENGAWGTPVRINDIPYRPVQLGKNPHPVVTRAGSWLLSFWEGNDTLMASFIGDLNGSWRLFGCGGWSELEETAINFHNPSVTTGHGPDNPGLAYQTFDDGYSIRFWSWEDGPMWSNLGVVPASVGAHSYSSQVSGEVTHGSGENHKVHVVWESYGEYEPPPSTDGGAGWKYLGSSPNLRRVNYQGCTGVNGGTPRWTTADVFTNSNGSFYHPTISHLASGTIVMAWDDGSNTYKAQREPDGEWKVSQVHDNMVNPNYLAGETEAGTLASTRFIASTSSGPLYTLALGGEQGDAPPELVEELGRRVTASTVPPTRQGRIRLENHGADRIRIDVGRDGSAGSLQVDTTGFFGVELSGLILKRSDGSVQRLIFTDINDIAPGLADTNAWQKLGTAEFPLPSNADSIIILGASSLKNMTRIRGNGENSIRLAFDLVDAANDSVLKRLGNERVFGRDSAQFISVRSRVAQFAGRRVLVRPMALGIARGRKDIAYTVVHVHKIITDNSATRPSLRMNTVAGEQTLPTTFALHQNYPNPFNPATRIKFDLPEPANVSLVLYDVLGKEVATVVCGYREAGYHAVTWNAAIASSGVYFAFFTATDATGGVRFKKMSKLLLLK